MNLTLAGLSFKNSETVLGILLIILMLGVIAYVIALPWLSWFKQELKFLNIEIERHKHNPREQERWKRRKKRLWRSILPFVKYE